MRKGNLFKGIVCGLMLTAVVGTAAFAGTVERSAMLKNVGTYSDYYSGDVGHYTASGTSTQCKLTTVNNTSSPRKYECSLRRYNTDTDTYDAGTTEVVTLAPGVNHVKTLTRDYDNKNYNYRNQVIGYLYTNTTSVVSDNYTYLVTQAY